MRELTEREIELLLSSDDRDLETEIVAAATQAQRDAIRERATQLTWRIDAVQLRMQHEREMAHRCVKVVIDARSRGRLDLVKAARARENEHLENLGRCRAALPRLRALLARMQAT